MPKPPTAKEELDKEHPDTDKQTHGVATIGGEVEEEREIDEGTNDGLRYVVGETHLAIESKTVDTFAKSVRLVE